MNDPSLMSPDWINPYPTYPSYNIPESPKSNTWKWIVGGLILLLIIGVGGGLLYYFLMYLPGQVNPNPDQGIPILNQPDSSLQIVNATSENPLQISLQINETGNGRWVKLSGDGTLGPAVIGDFTKNPPNYQLVTLNLNQTIVVQMPEQKNAWRVTPLRSTGMPILIECGPGLVCNASAVDGVNYLLRMELTAGDSTPVSVIDMATNPCPTKAGCNNPAVDGTFKAGTTWESEPCHAGTCNLTGPSLAYCEAIHNGQCANTTSVRPKGQRAANCQAQNSYTTYCYSHDDQNSSPPLVAPYKLKATYRDLP